MSATLTHNELYQSVVDSEFRGELLENPKVFGIAGDGMSLPAPVAQPNQADLEFWTEGVAATEVYACATSCSWGPFTIVCDGTTK